MGLKAGKGQPVALGKSLRRGLMRRAKGSLERCWACSCGEFVALERPAGRLKGFEGGRTAALNALKNRWLEHVACSCESCCLGKARGRVWGV